MSRPTRACELKSFRGKAPDCDYLSRPTRACELKLDIGKYCVNITNVTPYTGV